MKGLGGRNLFTAAAATVVGSALLAGSAAAATYQNSWTKRVGSGGTVIVYQGDDVGDDCRAIDLPGTSVMYPPRHGQTYVAHAQVMPHFPSSNYHSRCNSTLVEGVYVYYKADPGFVGTDHLTVYSRSTDRNFMANVTIKVLSRPAVVHHVDRLVRTAS